MKKSRLKIRGTSETSVLKEKIQALVRQIVIVRDGGCILRHYPETGQCGGYRKDGELILQGEHLHTRSNAASFADTRLIVCLCQRHHIFYKPQHSDEYFKIVKKHIGKQRSALLKKVQEDCSPHKTDLKLSIVALENELQLLLEGRLSTDDIALQTIR